MASFEEDNLRIGMGVFLRSLSPRESHSSSGVGN